NTAMAALVAALRTYAIPKPANAPMTATTTVKVSIIGKLFDNKYAVAGGATINAMISTAPAALKAVVTVTETMNMKAVFTHFVTIPSVEANSRSKVVIFNF